MGLIDCASGSSLWRGYDYYKEKTVKAFLPTSDTTFRGIVEGSHGESYSVTIALSIRENQPVIVLLQTVSELFASIK